jgi:hypothetical protein
LLAGSWAILQRDGRAWVRHEQISFQTSVFPRVKLD